LAGDDQSFLPSPDTVDDPVDLSIDLFVGYLPLFHFGQLHFGGVIVAGLVGNDAVVLFTFCRLQQLLSHFRVGFILVASA
jgi:hypothetical protein